MDNIDKTFHKDDDLVFTLLLSLLPTAPYFTVLLLHFMTLVIRYIVNIIRLVLYINRRKELSEGKKGRKGKNERKKERKKERRKEDRNRKKWIKKERKKGE